MKRLFLVLAYMFCVFFSHARNSEEVTDKSFSLNASFVSEYVNNLRGGIKTGHGYLGMITLELGIDAEKTGLWKGGKFFINAANTHGATPSADMLGDMQVISNIEAGNHTFFLELWYKHQIKNVELILGLQDLNEKFANSKNGELYLNSSFGILPVISGNIAAPIFPLTALGLTIQWKVSQKTSWLNALYDGGPIEFDYNPYNLKWKFASGDGILAISEIQQKLDIKGLPGVCKLGMFAHNHLFEKHFMADFPDSLNHSIIGAYFYVDQKLWTLESKSISVFLQTGYSPSEISFNNAYLGLGLNFSGILSRAKNDIIGLAVAHANFSNGRGYETAIELTWKKQIHRNIFIQPDLQYVIHPFGRLENLNNALAGILRLSLIL